MLLRSKLRWIGWVLLGGISLSATPVLAWNPFKSAENAVGDALKTGGRKLGDGLGQGAVDALQPALVSTVGTVSRAAGSLVADVDTRITREA